MQNGGSALMGTGIAEGEGRGVKATDLALSSPLLEDINVDGATGVLVNVSHGENFSMLEYEEAMEQPKQDDISRPSNRLERGTAQARPGEEDEVRCGPCLLLV